LSSDFWLKIHQGDCARIDRLAPEYLTQMGEAAWRIGGQKAGGSAAPLAGSWRRPKGCTW
jgi:hypothetical protein